MPSLAERVDVVIGVDTHKYTHTAAAVAAATGAKLDELSIGTDSDGYAALLTWAQSHPGDRAWSLEGAGGCSPADRWAPQPRTIRAAT